MDDIIYFEIIVFVIMYGCIWMIDFLLKNIRIIIVLFIVIKVYILYFL